MKKYLIPIMLIVLVFSLISCTTIKQTNKETTTAEEVITTQSSNNPPIAKINIIGKLQKSKTIKFDAFSSSDADHDPLTYEWLLPDGTKSNEGSVNFTPTKLGDYEVNLTVSDGKSQSADKQIFKIENSAPEAIAKSDKIDIQLGETVQLNGNASFDSDGDILSYKWSLPNNSKMVEGSQISFTPTETGKQLIILYVTDGERSNSADITINVTQSEEQFKKSCKNVKYSELLRNPDDYLMKPIHVKGEIVQYLSNEEFHFNITKGSYGFWDDRAWLVLNNPSEENIIEDDIVEVWGFGGGNQEYKTALGSTNTIPLIFAEYVEIIQKAD